MAREAWAGWVGRIAAAGASGVLALVLVAPAGAADQVSGSGSSSEAPTSTTVSAPVNAATQAEVEAAAVAWAKAFLTGSAADIRRLQGPECRSTTTLSKADTERYLRGLRAVMRETAGKPLRKINVVGVETRNLTSTRGEAEVRYDLPEAAAGNDNWVEFTRRQGRWKVSNCHAPIFGHSTSSTPSS